MEARDRTASGVQEECRNQAMQDAGKPREHHGGAECQGVPLVLQIGLPDAVRMLGEQSMRGHHLQLPPI
jgi:hypothetical protein